MSKRFIVEKIEVEKGFDAEFKVPYRISHMYDKDGRSFDDYIKTVPDNKYYIAYDMNTKRIVASCLYDITAIPIIDDTNIKLVYTWINVPANEEVIPFNRKNERIPLRNIAMHTAGNIFMSHETDDIFHLSRYEYINEFGQITFNLNKLKEELKYTIEFEINKIEYIGYTYEYKSVKYLQPFRTSDINDLKMLIDLPAFDNDDIKLYIHINDYERDSSQFNKSSMTDGELNNMLARMFKLNISRKNIINEMNAYIDTFTDGHLLYNKFNCRINDKNVLETDMYKYIIDKYINV